MDIDFLRTFLEVKRTRHFAQAAKALFVSQSTISARIRLLEEELQTLLFSRTRNDIQLTEAGKRLVPQAEALLSLWEQARRSLTPLDDRPQLRIGSPPALWPLLQQLWQKQLQATPPQILLTGEASAPAAVLQGLLSQKLDLGLGWEPPPHLDLAGHLLAERELFLVSGQPGLTWERAKHQGLIQVAWGPEAASEPMPLLRLDPGPWIKELLCLGQACAYLPLAWISAELAQGRLYLVEAAPPLACRVYAWLHQRPKQAAALQGILAELLATKNYSGW